MKQLNELRPYYQALSHIALQRILMDLDEGVKKNYQLFDGRKEETDNQLVVKDIKRGIQVWVSFISLLLQ